MLRDSGLGEGKFVHDIATNTGVSAREKTNDLDPGGMTQSLGKYRQLFVGFRAFDGSKI